MPKREPNTPQKIASRPQTAKTEIVTVPTAAKRDGFTVGEWRAAMKQAENVTTPSRVKLYDLYNDTLLDPHLISAVGKRVDNIRATQWSFDCDGKPNDKIDAVFRSVWFRDMLESLLEARFWGYSAYWLDLSGGEHRNSRLLPRKHILPQSGQYVKNQSDRAGTDFTQAPASNYVITAGRTDDLGLLLVTAVWVLFKRGDISDWATFNEMYAMPFRKGKYPPHDDRAKKALAEACRDSASNGFVIIPNDTELEFIQAQASGSVDAYLKFAEFCDKQVSKAIVRNTMTLDAEGGQYKGDVHAESEAGVFASDRQFILDILNTQFKAILELHGYTPGDGLFSFALEDHLCLKDRIEIDKEVDTKVEIAPEYWYRKYGIPVPEGGPKLKADPTAVAVAKLSEQMSAIGLQLAERERRELADGEPLPADPKKKGLFDFFH